VISGDALTDIDPGEGVGVPSRARRAGDGGAVAAAHPLEYGIVVTDDEGRVERFLEKPGWGQVSPTP